MTLKGIADGGALPEKHVKILVKKLANKQLALFVGAGLSRQAIAKDGSGRRLPLWEELAEKVAEACNHDLQAYGGKILYLFEAIDKHQGRFDLEEAVRSALRKAIRLTISEIPCNASRRKPMGISSFTGQRISPPASPDISCLT